MYKICLISWKTFLTGTEVFAAFCLFLDCICLHCFCCCTHCTKTCTKDGHFNKIITNLRTFSFFDNTKCWSCKRAMVKWSDIVVNFIWWRLHLHRTCYTTGVSITWPCMTWPACMCGPVISNITQTTLTCREEDQRSF